MMSRWRESGRAPPLTIPTEARRRRRRVEPPRRLPPPWRRKRQKLLGSPLPKHLHLCKILFLRHCLFICLPPVLMHFARFRKKSTTSLKKTSIVCKSWEVLGFSNLPFGISFIPFRFL